MDANDYFFQNNRYKEFFLHILLSQLAKLPIYKPYDKMQILLDKRKFEDYRFEFDLEEEYAKNLFMHLKAKNSKTSLYEIETDDEVIELIDDYNSKIFPTKSADYILFTYINTMVLSIDYFLKNVIEINNKTKIKKFLNSEIKFNSSSIVIFFE